VTLCCESPHFRINFDAAAFGFLDGEEVGDGVPRPFPRIRPLSACTFFAISSAVTGESFAGAVRQSQDISWMRDELEVPEAAASWA
jgi:hypothetical protein